ncbi:MAG TPA: cation:proton antiporter [Vulgatibacter sp.]|nr:cation:proton antiporter [Vulgatibacter sp.]
MLSHPSENRPANGFLLALALVVALAPSAAFSQPPGEPSGAMQAEAVAPEAPPAGTSQPEAVAPEVPPAGTSQPEAVAPEPPPAGAARGPGAPPAGVPAEPLPAAAPAARAAGPLPAIAAPGGPDPEVPDSRAPLDPGPWAPEWLREADRGPPAAIRDLQATDETAQRLAAPEAGDVAPPPPIPPAKRPPVLIKTILGLIALLALAYLGGHPRMRVIEKRLRISQVVTAGFPFIALGVVANLPSVGILTDSVLDELTPLLRFGLGWIGFAAGYRFDTRAFDDLPKDTAKAVGFATLMPFLTVLTAASLLLLLASDWTESTFRDPIFLRDALILGTAGAMTARAASRLVKGNADYLWLQRFKKIVQLEQLAGIAGLAFIAAYFRPQGPDLGWHLPGTAWIFLTVGLGATIGIVAYTILRRPATGAESVVLLLGTVAFAAGSASALFLSPIVVCFVAGVLLANFPGASKDRLGEALEKLERPIYLLFLVVVGAIWNFEDWRGWVLLVVFVAARLTGKWLGAHLTSRYTNFDTLAHERWISNRAPMGQLSIAIVVSAQLLFPHGSIPIVVTAVIGGAIVTEVLVQVFARKASPTEDVDLDFEAPEEPAPAIPPEVA